MRAFLPTLGIVINFVKEDKGKSQLECFVSNFEGPKVFLYVKGEVHNSGKGEEPGFHIETFPRVELREAEKINIYLSKKRWDQITTQIDPEAKQGYFGSRSAYDHVSFHYWDEEISKKPNGI